MQSIDILIQNRGLFKKALAQVSNEAYLEIPPGFDNNIAWNLGHVIVTQEALLFRLSGLPLAVTPEENAMYKTGTSPADWDHEPDIPRLLRLLEETPPKIQANYSQGNFRNYKAYTTSTGIHLPTIDDALAFNNFHEGLHLGFILALKNFTGP